MQMCCVTCYSRPTRAGNDTSVALKELEERKIYNVDTKMEKRESASCAGYVHVSVSTGGVRDKRSLHTLNVTASEGPAALSPARC